MNSKMPICREKCQLQIINGNICLIVVKYYCCFKLSTDESYLYWMKHRCVVWPFLVGRRKTEYFQIPSQHIPFRQPYGCVETQNICVKKLILPPKNIPCFDAHKEWPMCQKIVRENFSISKYFERGYEIFFQLEIVSNFGECLLIMYEQYYNFVTVCRGCHLLASLSHLSS